MPLDRILNFVAVSPDLASGGQPTELELEDIARAGFEVVINLGLLDPAYCLPDEAGHVIGLGMAYHHIPVDFHAPALEDLRRFCARMDACSGKRVFVHCAANKRVSAFLALYAEAKLGWSRAEADALIARVWAPTPVWKAFIEAARRPEFFARLG